MYKVQVIAYHEIVSLNKYTLRGALNALIDLMSAFISEHQQAVLKIYDLKGMCIAKVEL